MIKPNIILLKDFLFSVLTIRINFVLKFWVNEGLFISYIQLLLLLNFQHKFIIFLLII